LSLPSSGSHKGCPYEPSTCAQTARKTRRKTLLWPRTAARNCWLGLVRVRPLPNAPVPGHYSPWGARGASRGRTPMTPLDRHPRVSRFSGTRAEWSHWSPPAREARGSGRSPNPASRAASPFGVWAIPARQAAEEAGSPPWDRREPLPFRHVSYNNACRTHVPPCWTGVPGLTSVRPGAESEDYIQLRPSGQAPALSNPTAGRP
jgi:hypothetical protein